jgi:chemotaxis-related protein WspD
MSDVADTSLPVVQSELYDCWNRIGVGGDGSCEQLAVHVHCRNCPVFAEAGEQLFDRPVPEAFQREATAQLAQNVDEGDRDSTALVVFRVGGEWLALPVQSAVEIAAAPAAQRIPHRRERELLGLVNVRGELHLCISLRELLGLDGAARPAGSPAGNDKPMLLIAEHEGTRWALLVDEIADVQRVASQDASSVPATVARRQDPLTHKVFVSRERRVGMIDERRLFGLLKRRFG